MTNSTKKVDAYDEYRLQTTQAIMLEYAYRFDCPILMRYEHIMSKDGSLILAGDPFFIGKILTQVISYL